MFDQFTNNIILFELRDNVKGHTNVHICKHEILLEWLQNILQGLKYSGK